MTNKFTDITDQVEFIRNDNEMLPITKCICGHQFAPWDFFISIYPNMPDECPECGVKLFFGVRIRVYKINE